MKILLAPSETKISGGIEPFKLDTLLFKSLLHTRTKLLNKYINIIQQEDISELSTMFGLKKESNILKNKKIL